MINFESSLCLKENKLSNIIICLIQSTQVKQNVKIINDTITRGSRVAQHTSILNQQQKQPSKEKEASLTGNSTRIAHHWNAPTDKRLDGQNITHNGGNSLITKHAKAKGPNIEITGNDLKDSKWKVEVHALLLIFLNIVYLLPTNSLPDNNQWQNNC